MTRRRTRSPAAHLVATTPRGDPPEDQGAPLTPPSGSSDGIPPHVWNTLQEAGAEAAERLRELLSSPRFAKYRPGEQKALIELALTRAYGLPVRRSVNVSLSSDDADAIAASITGLSDALPERQAAPRDVTPPDDASGAE